MILGKDLNKHIDNYNIANNQLNSVHQKCDGMISTHYEALITIRELDKGSKASSVAMGSVDKVSGSNSIKVTINYTLDSLHSLMDLLLLSKTESNMHMVMYSNIIVKLMSIYISFFGTILKEKDLFEIYTNYDSVTQSDVDNDFDIINNILSENDFMCDNILDKLPEIIENAIPKLSNKIVVPLTLEYQVASKVYERYIINDKGYDRYFNTTMRTVHDAMEIVEDTLCGTYNKIKKYKEISYVDLVGRAV